jgi:ATP-dependent RNA helicase RhlE
LTDFTTLGLAAPLLRALAEEGYTAPTPIQAQAIPIILTGRDLLGIAQTGTGKTAAFALPILHQLAARKKPAPRHGCRVLVLAPTRELASQIAKSFKTYGAGLNISVAAVYGGVPHGPQIKALAGGVDVLVATPGRLVDHLDAHRARLNGAEFLVLDEIDQMLDLGFVKPIRRIVGELPRQRQNLFFSATMPAEIRKLAAEFLVNPATVSVAPVATTAERVQHQVVFIEAARKRGMLVELFGDTAMTRAIVFTRTKRGADKVAQHLENAGISTSAIHGNKSQGQRERSLSAFKAGRVRALVATDIAARGIDIDDVSHVINFELPEVPENYVHRIGRTARAGAAGVAISLCDGEERNLLRNIEKLTRLNLPSVDRRSGDERAAVQRSQPRPAARPAARSAGRFR